MSTIALPVDSLGEMFTPDEKRLLRCRKPEHKEARDRLIVRLADAFTFRRAPRGWRPPFNGFEKAALLENVDISRCGLPAMSQGDLAKANEYNPLLPPFVLWLIFFICRVMEYAERIIRHQHPPSNSSGVTAGELKDIIRISQGEWQKDSKDRKLEAIIDSIPNNTQINKVVCIGLSEIAVRFGPRSQNATVISRGLAQHLAIVSSK